MTRHISVLALAAAIALAACQPATSDDNLTERERIAPYKKQKRVGDLQVGDEAPDFTLDAADGSKTVQLSSFKGKRDVVLIFGSYT